MASRGARSNTVVPHAIRRSRVAGGFVAEAEAALEAAGLRGIVVNAGSGLLFALFGSRDGAAGVEASSHCWVPDASGVGVASKET